MRLIGRLLAAGVLYWLPLAAPIVAEPSPANPASVHAEAALATTPPSAGARRVASTAPAPTPRTVSNLIAFSRLLGYVRYFYPGDQAAAVDWNAFAVDHITAVEALTDTTTLARVLQRLFAPYAPDVRVFVTGEAAPALPASLRPPSRGGPLSITEWQHSGFGIDAAPDWVQMSDGYQDPELFNRRAHVAVAGGRIPAGFDDPARPYLADLSGGVSALIPLSLYADRSGTLPHTRPPQPPAPDALPFAADRAAWLADIAIAWNVLQHFYTYFDTLDASWDQALPAALAATAATPSQQGFERALKRMLARLDDGHVYLWQRALAGTEFSGVLPLNWDWVAGKLTVVTTVAGEVGTIRPGDEVLRIAGRPVRTVLASPDNITGGTPQYRRYVAFNALRTGMYPSTVTLELRTPAGIPYTARVKREPVRATPALRSEPRPVRAIATIRPGILYVDLTRVTEEQLSASWDILQRARGMVFDLRGYPTDAAMDLLGHLSNTPLRTAPFLLPLITYPDHARIAYRDLSWSIPPSLPTLTRKRVFLINGDGVVSYGETVLAIVDAYHLGPLVGSNTDGTNGAIAFQELPGGYAFSWTGVKVTKHDGTPLMHVGYAPTVPVQRTRKGVIEGRDEVLERGLQVLGQER